MSEQNRIRVLVVDDSTDLRELITLVIDLHEPDWRVVGTAADGREAVEAAREIQPDVVLLDVAMPVMDGLEALPLIRDAAPAAVVVMLSSYPASTYERAALVAGAHGYLEKSDLMGTLVSRVDQIRRLTDTDQASTGS